MGAIPCCVICPNPYKPVSQGNVGLVTKFGSERLIQVDVKIQIVGMFKWDRECTHKS
jgi:erythrocyte band 7 integral membrane protein